MFTSMCEYVKQNVCPCLDNQASSLTAANRTTGEVPSDVERGLGERASLINSLGSPSSTSTYQRPLRSDSQSLIGYVQSCRFCQSIAQCCTSIQQTFINFTQTHPGALAAANSISTLIANSMVWTYAEQRATNKETEEVNRHQVAGFMVLFAYIWNFSLAVIFYLRKREFKFMNTLSACLQQAGDASVNIELFFFTIRDVLCEDSMNASRAILLAGSAAIAATALGTVVKTGIERVIFKIQEALGHHRTGQMSFGHRTLAYRILSNEEREQQRRPRFGERMFNGDKGSFSWIAGLMFIFIFLLKEYEPFRTLSDRYFGTDPYISALPFIGGVILSSTMLTALLLFLRDVFPSVAILDTTQPHQGPLERRESPREPQEP